MKKQIILLTFTLISGILLGWIFFHTGPTGTDTLIHPTVKTQGHIWTCAMHPQIRITEPGKCPICAMELIPLIQAGGTIDPGAIKMTKESAQLANVLTSVVSSQNPVKDLRLYGKVQADERLLQSQVSYLPGRIEKLFVNFTGEVVRKGEVLAVIYAPDLITAQQELLETVAVRQTQPALYEAAKEKLRQWKLSDSQIAAIESTASVKNDFEIYANTTGIVTARRVSSNDFISAGTVLFEVADLSRVWVLFDAYESDLPYLSKNQKITFSFQALPGAEYTGTLTFIDPVMDPVSRVAKVRVEVANPAGKLKPEMFATGIVQASLNEAGNKLVIPRSAVLWTGKRSVVYVKQPGSDDPIFKIREIELGSLLGNSYLVLNGLKEGEEIVTEGAFSVDASAQLEGKPSMMNPPSDQLPVMKAGKKAAQSESALVSYPTGKAVPSAFHQASFHVSGNCDQCRDRIEAAAKSVAGVKSANWEAKTGKLELRFEETKTNIDAIQRAIAKVGHDTGKYKAGDEVYKSLPACCLYRK